MSNPRRGNTLFDKGVHLFHIFVSYSDCALKLGLVVAGHITVIKILVT